MLFFGFKHRVWKTLESDPLFAHSQVELTMEANRQLCMERVLRVLEYDFLPEDELMADPRLVRTYHIVVIISGKLTMTL